MDAQRQVSQGGWRTLSGFITETDEAEGSMASSAMVLWGRCPGFWVGRQDGQMVSLTNMAHPGRETRAS